MNKEEKQRLLNIIIERLYTISNKIDIKQFLKKEVIGNVFDLEALRNWDCTLIPDGRFTLEAVRCLGCCSLAPVMRIDDKTYGRLRLDKIDSILKRFE